MGRRPARLPRMAASTRLLHERETRSPAPACPGTRQLPASGGGQSQEHQRGACDSCCRRRLRRRRHGRHGVDAERATPLRRLLFANRHRGTSVSSLPFGHRGAPVYPLPFSSRPPRPNGPRVSGGMVVSRRQLRWRQLRLCLYALALTKGRARAQASASQPVPAPPCSLAAHTRRSGAQTPGVDVPTAPRGRRRPPGAPKPERPNQQQRPQAILNIRGAFCSTGSVLRGCRSLVPPPPPPIPVAAAATPSHKLSFFSSWIDGGSKRESTASGAHSRCFRRRCAPSPFSPERTSSSPVHAVRMQSRSASAGEVAAAAAAMARPLAKRQHRPDQALF
eukprot:361801-Chlamydomonas_euryale.AAC.6